MDSTPTSSASAAVSRATMYSVEDEDTSSSSETTEDNVETVKTTETNPVGGGGLLQAIVGNSAESESESGVVSKNEVDIGIENEEDEADIDEYFNDLFPDRNRLDTVEEVTEPMSSYHESLPLDLADEAKISGQPSSDFAHESLPPDFNNSMTSMSVTSREEMYSVSEVEVLATTWPPPHYSSPLSSSQRTVEAAPEATGAMLGTMGFSTKGSPPLDEEEMVQPQKAASNNNSSLADDSEDNSLSISLPSEGSQKIIQIKAGILKIFDQAEEDVNQTETIAVNLTPIKSFDNVIFEEKHEFEKTEKMKAKISSASAASTASEIDFDSGYEQRGVESRNSSKVWNKIHKQLHRRFGGSSGSLSSTTSPNSEVANKQSEAFNTKTVTSLDSPIEGSSKGLLKTHVKDLVAQLSQAEEEKEKIAQEAYKKAMEIKAEADRRLQDAYQCQNKQTSLIERLKAKVEDYKGQCSNMEARLSEVNQLANQSQLQVNDTTHVLQNLEERLQSTEERHRTEVLAFQARLQEQRDIVETLEHTNQVLKNELFESKKNNDKYQGDLKQIGEQWRAFNEELKSQQVKEDSKACNQDLGEVGHPQVTKVWSDVLHLRRQWMDLKMSTQQDLVKTRNDMANATRQISQACVELTSTHHGQGGFQTSDELWNQLQKCRSDRQGLEHKVLGLERDLVRCKGTNQLLEQSLSDEKSNVTKLTVTNTELKSQMQAQVDQIFKLQQISKQKSALESSLLDITNLAEEHLEHHDDNEDETDLSLTTFNAPKVVKFVESPLVDRRRSSEPLRGDRRRTRSASPAPSVDTALASVQAALHKKKFQVYELKSKLSSYGTKLSEFQKATNAKDDLLRKYQKELDKEKEAVDMLKIQVQDTKNEHKILQEKYDRLHVEKEKCQRSKHEVQEDILVLSKEKSILTETHQRIMTELKTTKCEVERLAQVNKSLTKENKERLNLISQLEQVGSCQRQELIKTKDEINQLQANLKSNRRSENPHRIIPADNDVITANKSTREKDLEETIEQLEKFQKELKVSCQRLENSMQVMTEEKLQLNLQITEQKTSLQKSTDQLDSVESRCRQVSAEKSTLQQLYQNLEQKSDKLEMELRKAAMTKDDLENQFTSLTLQKDALEDEINHKRIEVDDINAHLEQVSALNSALNRDNNELAIKQDSLVKNVEALERQVKALMTDKANWYQEMDDMQHNLQELEVDHDKLLKIKDELSGEKEALTKQMKLLKQNLEEEVARAELEKSQLEEEKDDIKFTLEKTVKKYKNQIFEIETEASRQREELKSRMNQAHSQELKEAIKIKEEEIGTLSKDLEEALENLNRLNKIRNEELLLTENAKEQALIMSQHEQKSLSERLNEALANLETSQRDLEQHRLESNTKSEKDRCCISDLQIEVSKLRGSLQDRHNQLDQAKAKLLERLEVEKQERLSAENEINVLKSSLKAATDAEQQLNEQVTDLKSKCDFLSEDKQKVALQLRETEKQLEELQAKHGRVEQMKIKLSDTVQLLEEDKLQLVSDCDQIKSKLKHHEENHYLVQQDYFDLQSKQDKLRLEHEELEEDNQHLKGQCQELQRDLQAAQFEHQQAKTQWALDEDNKEAEERKLQQARLRINELESSQTILEKELNSLRALSSTDQESTRQKLSTLNQTIDDIRGREKRLEDQRHDLEQQLNFAQQQIKDLTMQINGKDGRLGELYTTIAKLEGNKADLETKINNVASLLHHVRSSSNTRSRPSTPTTAKSVSAAGSGLRRASSPWPSSPWPPSSEASNASNTPDFDMIKKDIRDLVAKIGHAGKERDEAYHHLAAVKRQHNDLIEINADLEAKFVGQKKKSKTFEEQLKRLESKMVQNDLQLADQEEKLEIRESELRQLSGKLETTKGQLEALRKAKEAEERSGGGSGNDLALLRRSYDGERRQLQNDLSQLEALYSQLEVAKKAAERENQRLKIELGEKDKEIQNLKVKCDNLGRGVGALEDKCSNLSVTVDNLNVQLEKSLKNESVLHDKLADLNHEVTAQDFKASEVDDKNVKLMRQLERVKTEKQVIEDQLEASQLSLQESRKRILYVERDLDETQTALQKSESKVNQLDLSLQASQSRLEVNSNDTYLKDELSRIRRENESLLEQVQDLSKRLTMLDRDKKDIEKKLSNVKLQQKSMIGSNDQVDHYRSQLGHVRSQIPLVSAGGPHAHAEQMVKMRGLEQDNERLVRKIRGLEQQLSDLELLHGKRVQELLQDRRQEREKESRKQTEIYQELESSQHSRERILKERIQGLEKQVDLLKQQLSKEVRRRQTYILESSGISNEISELRQHLDQSLKNVHDSTDGKTIDRETGRLNVSVDRYGTDYTSRLTPSKLHQTSTPRRSTSAAMRSRKSVKSLHFEHDHPHHDI